MTCIKISKQEPERKEEKKSEERRRRSDKTSKSADGVHAMVHTAKT